LDCMDWTIEKKNSLEGFFGWVMFILY
jgi:hypothetical protein